MEKKKSKLKIILFSLVPLLVLLISVELILRVVYFQRNNNEVFAITALIHKIKGGNQTAPLAYRFVRLKEHIPLQNITMRPKREDLNNFSNMEDKDYPFITDSNGFILPMVNYPDPDFSLVFIGGSTTECSFVSGESRFPFLTGKILFEKANKKINVYNSGVSGNHTYHAIDLLVNKIIPMKPKYVVLMECINDWTTLLFEGTYWNNNPTRSLIIDPNSKIRVNNDEWAHLRGKKLIWDKNYILNEFKKAQITFIGICRANNIEPVLMTQANRYLETPDKDIIETLGNKLFPFGLTYEDVRMLNEETNNIIRKNAADLGVVLIDLDKGVPKSKELMVDIVHYSDKGSVMAADIISKELIKIIK